MFCVIRVNAHPQLGNGHLMRCLTVARVASQHGLKPLLVLSDIPGVPLAFITAARWDYTFLPAADEINDAELFCTLLTQLNAHCWVVVDVYAFGICWHEKVYPHCQQLLVIDDLANRHYVCDALLDHTPGRLAKDYTPWLNTPAQLFVGAEHALLAPEFFAAVADAHSVRNRYFELKPRPKLLISLGGTDVQSFCLLWFDLLMPYANEFSAISFLLASNAQVIPALRERVVIYNQALNDQDLHGKSSGTIQLIIDAKAMPQLLLEHDLALGGAGVSALERAALGMPSVMLTLADNQIKQAQSLAHFGCAYDLGDWQQVPEFSVQQAAVTKLLKIKNDYAQCQALSERAFYLIAPQQPYKALIHFFTTTRAGIKL